MRDPRGVADLTDVVQAELSNISRWALGDGHGLKLLSWRQRIDWIKRNVRCPQVWGKSNPTHSGYWPSAV